MSNCRALLIAAALSLPCAGCGLLHRESPAEAARNRQAEELQAICGTSNLALAPRRLEAGAAVEPHQCREMLKALGAI